MRLRILKKAALVSVGWMAMSLTCSWISPAAAATLVDEVFYDGAATAVAVRNVVFGPTGAQFDSPYSGIDYADAALSVEGTIELVLRSQDGTGAVLDTRGADLRHAGDLYLGIVAGPYGSSTLQDAVAGQLFFTIDPGPGTNPGLLPGVLSTTILNDGAWHTVSVSYGSAGLALYIDGVLEDTAETITVQTINAVVSLGDFADQFVPGAFAFIGEILRFRTSDLQNDVTPLNDGLLATGVGPDRGPVAVPLLEQNTPNPFNPSTTLAFNLPSPTSARLSVYDPLGRLVRRLLDGEWMAEGRQEVRWNGLDDNGRSVPSGTYCIRLMTDVGSDQRLITLLK